jgi:predicted metal-binding protein
VVLDRPPYHSPFAPSVDETKDVLSEYTKAILLNGPKGKAITDVAVRLEGEAYQMGFYKAFALTALPSGSGGESNSGAT